MPPAAAIPTLANPEAKAHRRLVADLAPTIAGKHPFSPDYLAELAAHGDWLIAHLKPEGAVAAPAEASEAALVRDRMWTLLKRRHAHLREAGVVVFGLDALDDHIPPLGSRTRARPAPKEPAAPSPT